MNTFDPKERRKAKAAQREKDELDLIEGRITHEELKVRNSFFNPLDVVHAKILRRQNSKFE